MNINTIAPAMQADDLRLALTKVLIPPGRKTKVGQSPCHSLCEPSVNLAASLSADLSLVALFQTCTMTDAAANVVPMQVHMVDSLCTRLEIL